MEYQNYSSTPASDLFPQQTLVYGGFWERFGAAFLDGLILVIPAWIIQAALGDVTGSLFTIVLYWLYYALLESGQNQATFGKKALGLKVTGLQGERISFGQATGRFFGKYLSALILLIGYLMMLWDNRKQTLHDKMAGTLVVKR